MINWYGIVIAAACLTGILLFENLAKKAQLKEEFIWNAVFITLLCGIVGARIYHVLHYWDLYKLSPISMLYVWNGGLGIFGGLLGGLTGGIIYLTYKKQSVLLFTDCAALAMPLAQAVGRWANYFNLEHIPFFIYESAFDLLLFLILLLLYITEKPKMGVFTSLYILGYGIIRLLTEETKKNAWEISGINLAQGVSTAMILGAIIMLVYLRYGNNNGKRTNTY